MKDISQIDPNFKIHTASGGIFHNVDLPPFRLYGVKKDKDGYFRMPPEIAAKVSEGVATLIRQTAGGLVKFRTNAPKLSLRAEQSIGNGIMPHMTALGSAGFDLYSGEHFVASFPPAYPYGNDYSCEKELYLEKAEPDQDGFFEMTLYFPLYGAYRAISLSVPDGYEFRSSETPFRNAGGLLRFFHYPRRLRSDAGYGIHQHPFAQIKCILSEPWFFWQRQGGTRNDKLSGVA